MYNLKIGGFQKFSLIDYPKLISAVIFTRACNFRCPFCHNPELVIPERYSDIIDPEIILEFLKKRVGKLDSLTITGGEPTLQKDLIPFIESVRQMGYKIKLDTNGSNPEVIRNILEGGLVDFIAMDIKAPLESYSKLSGVPVSLSAIKESIQLILDYRISYQFRTTLVPSLYTENMKVEIERWMKKLEADHIFQDFVPGKILDKKLL